IARRGHKVSQIWWKIAHPGLEIAQRGCRIAHPGFESEQQWCRIARGYKSRNNGGESRPPGSKSRNDGGESRILDSKSRAPGSKSRAPIPKIKHPVAFCVDIRGLFWCYLVCNGFNLRSILSRFSSRNGGSANDSPRCSGSSSVAKPGPSVASSNKMPFGSLK